MTSNLWSVGHLTVDDVVFCDGSTQMGNLGGAALYAALGARFVGVPSTVVSRLGSGFPAEELNRLAALGVDTSLVPADTPPIHQWVLYERDGSRTYLLHPGSGSHDAMSPSPVEHAIPDGATVHIAPMPIEHQRSWCTALAASGHRLTVDPHAESCAENPAAVMALVPLVHAFLPSELEARHLVSGDPVEAVREFLAAGAAIAGVKLGDQGSLIGFGEEIWQVPALPVTVRDVTGAGDSFCGAFAAALSAGLDALMAARWATATASCVVETVGTGIRSEASRLIEAANRLPDVMPVRLTVCNSHKTLLMPTGRNETD